MTKEECEKRLDKNRKSIIELHRYVADSLDYSKPDRLNNHILNVLKSATRELLDTVMFAIEEYKE